MKKWRRENNGKKNKGMRKWMTRGEKSKKEGKKRDAMKFIRKKNGENKERATDIKISWGKVDARGRKNKSKEDTQLKEEVMEDTDVTLKMREERKKKWRRRRKRRRK